MSSLAQEEKGKSTGNLERKWGAEKQNGVEGSLEQEVGVQNSFSEPSSSRHELWDHSSEPRRISVLPLWWRMTHSSRWIAQVLASELSLVAFALLLVMVFSKKWLCLSRSRFYQRWPANVSTRIHTATHVMSMGLLRICKSRSCSNSENWNGETLHAPIPPQGSCLPQLLWVTPCPCPLLPVIPSDLAGDRASPAETTKDRPCSPHPSWARWLGLTQIVAFAKAQGLGCGCSNVARGMASQCR